MVKEAKIGENISVRVWVDSLARAAFEALRLFPSDLITSDF